MGVDGYVTCAAAREYPLRIWARGRPDRFQNMSGANTYPGDVGKACRRPAFRQLIRRCLRDRYGRSARRLINAQTEATIVEDQQIDAELSVLVL